MNSISSRPSAHNVVNPFVCVRGAERFIEFVTYVFNAQEAENVRTPDRDGSLIHAEIVIGNSTIMLADSKPDWPFTPALLQVYVNDAESVLNRVVNYGGKIITPISSFYGGFLVARFLDPWHNLWWLYTPDNQAEQKERKAEIDWRNEKPREVYTTLMDAMKNLAAPTKY